MLSDEEFILKLIEKGFNRKSVEMTIRVISITHMHYSTKFLIKLVNYNSSGKLRMYVYARELSKKLSTDKDRLKLLLLVGDYLIE